MSKENQDLAIRLAAFRWLTQAVDAHGDVLPRATLQQGVEYEGTESKITSHGIDKNISGSRREGREDGGK